MPGALDTAPPLRFIVGAVLLLLPALLLIIKKARKKHKITSKSNENIAKQLF